MIVRLIDYDGVWLVPGAGDGVGAPYHLPDGWRLDADGMVTDPSGWPTAILTDHQTGRPRAFSLADRPAPSPILAPAGD